MSTIDDQEEPTSVSSISSASVNNNTCESENNSYSSSSTTTTENTEPSVITSASHHQQSHQRKSSGGTPVSKFTVSSSSISNASNRQQLPTAIVAPTEITPPSPSSAVMTMNSKVLPPTSNSNVAQSQNENGGGSSGDPGSNAIVDNNRSVSIAPAVLSRPQIHDDDDSKRYCWVCFATDEDDMTAAWVKPCRCRGTTKWVHQACIQRWIDEKQKGNATTKVSCPQCNTEYYIYYPRQGSLVVLMDSVDTLISRVCPFVAAGIVVGSIYWTAVTYGAVTVMQVAGHKEGLAVMEQADPLVLLVGLPTIPIMLILGKMVRWEDYMLHFIRNHSWKVPLLRHILPTTNRPTLGETSLSQDIPPLSDPVSATRILCGALLLPTVSTLLGKALFENVSSNFKRALLGGMAFIAIKGVLRIYHKQQRFVRQNERKIMDFREPRSPAVTVRSSTSTTSTSTEEVISDDSTTESTSS